MSRSEVRVRIQGCRYFHKKRVIIKKITTAYASIEKVKISQCCVSGDGVCA